MDRFIVLTLAIDKPSLPYLKSNMDRFIAARISTTGVKAGI